MTRERLVLLRHRLSQHNVTEEYLRETLTRLGCRCIRPQVTLPCIVSDKNGRLFDEYSFVKMFLTKELTDKYNADYDSTISTANQNKSINRPLFKHLLKSRRAWIVLDKMTIDSVWSYEPIELEMTGDKVMQVRNMLASSIPMSNNSADLISYKRQAPVMQHPEHET